MRIAIDGRDVRSDLVTGIGRWVRTFVAHAARLAPADAFVLLSNEERCGGFLEGVKHHVLKGPTLWEDQMGVPFFLRREVINLFLNPYPKSPLFLPCPMVTIVCDVIPLLAEVYQTKEYFLMRLAFRRALSRTLKRSSKIIAISNYSKKDFVKTFGISEERIQVVYSGFDPLPCPPSKDEIYLKKTYGVLPPYILYVGNFLPHKNIPRLLKAYACLPKKIRDSYSLVLVGQKDQHTSRLQEETRSLQISDRVIFSGFVVEEDLPLFYQQATLFAFPSLYEGFGLPPLEAMAYGVPVMASDRTALPEVLGDAARLFNPLSVEEIAHATEEILSQPSLRASLAEKGLKRASEFTGEKMTRGILNVLKQTL